jgi:hypothetical protein
VPAARSLAPGHDLGTTLRERLGLGRVTHEHAHVLALLK